MRIKIINFIFGTTVLKASGNFPERIINIAKEAGIFIQDITAVNGGIAFTVSSKGAKLLQSYLPENIFLEEMSSHGIPFILKNHKSRKMLFICPLLILFLLFLSTHFIWNVNIIGADPATEEELLSELSRLGVKRGALKSSVDPSYIKNRLLIENESLLWIWVDIKGSSAIVRFANRTAAPELFNENEGYNIYASKGGIVTRIIATNGNAVINVGDEISEGQLLIEGTMQKNSEEIKQIHATGEIFAAVWEEKSVNISKEKEIRTPTGEKTQHLTIFFSKFPLKLFINSRILYSNYDIIESRRSFSFLPVTFYKKEYAEVTVTYEDNNIDLVKEKAFDDFILLLERQGYVVNLTESYELDMGGYIRFTMRALCEESVGKEVKIP